LGTKISTLFLFVVLALGMAAYPASINPTSLDSSPLNTSFLTAFAEEDDEERDDDDEKDDENELEHDEEKDEDDEKDDENELEHDEEKDEDETDDQEKDDDDDERDEDEEELEIEVEVKNDTAKIKIELNDDDYRFVLTDDVSESAIITAIMDKTGLTEDEITSNWEFEIEDEEREEDEDKENDGDSQVTDTAKTDKLIKHENKAQENAEETILELQQQINQLEQRLQKLLEKFETGEYFGTVTVPDPVPDSFVITIDGFASSLDDDTVVSNMEGEIFLESLMTASESTKLRITGGELLVGDTFYDFVIGKARLSSSGTSGDKDSMIILGQIMDDQGNVNTIRLSLDGTTSLDDFGSESVDFEINSSRSKIASQWGFDGVGLLSTL
jgi:hypothetical protein